jgi:CRP-like cAMP-binding protein
MREREFIAHLRELIESPVLGLDDGEKAEIVASEAARLRRSETGVECRLVPFVPGRRPTDEASHPWLGSSDQAAFILGHAPAENIAYLLFDVKADDGDYRLDVSVAFTGPDGSIRPATVPGWDRRPLPWTTFTSCPDGATALTALGLADGERGRLVIPLSPERDLFPGAAWSWGDVDAQIRGSATDEENPYTFGHLFAQEVRVEARLTSHEVPVAADEAVIFTCDARRLGSLYARLIDRLVGPDIAQQAAELGVADPGAAFHPWYPVLEIGREKTALYTKALIGDVVDKRHNLTDPGWLLRVGLHLEFLTFLGIVEAVKNDAGDLLTPAERSAFERSPLFREHRERIDPRRWKEVWSLRSCAFRGHGAPHTGPVSALNMIRKRRATLAFLHAHHGDLRHAIELAGPNHHNSQETWQRVFRDAERAVLRATPDAFPELAFLPRHVREFALWHRSGAARHRPSQLIGWLGDQDGLFASACTQYRRSMNGVAVWAKQRLLMDYTGDDCIPLEASLLEARIIRPSQVPILQRRDGYQAPLELAAPLPEEHERSADEIQRRLAETPTFAPLTVEELQYLARTARPITLGPLERLVREGAEGASLFVLAEGTLEVTVRREDGRDWPLGTVGPGAVIGEMSLLTGAPRSATVRAVDGATVYEIARQQYEPLLRSRPSLLDDLALIVEERLRATVGQRARYDIEHQRKAWRERIGHFMLRGDAPLGHPFTHERPNRGAGKHS